MGKKGGEEIKRTQHAKKISGKRRPRQAEKSTFTPMGLEGKPVTRVLIRQKTVKERGRT